MRTTSFLIPAALLLAPPLAAQSVSDSISALGLTTDQISASVPAGFAAFCVESLEAEAVATPGGRAGNWTEIGPAVAEGFARQIARSTGVEVAATCPGESDAPRFLVTPHRVRFTGPDRVDVLVSLRFSWGSRSILCLGRRMATGWERVGRCETHSMHDRVP